MSKTYLIVLVVLLVGIGAWYTMKKSPIGAPSSTVDTSATVVPSASASPTVAMGANTVKNQITLTVTSPKTNSTVTTPTVTVRGKTLANADVFVNEAETKADASGNFAVSVTLDEGENPIIVVANDASGNSAEAELMLTYTAN